jgi:uncharacterized protein (DUF2461 family)
MFEGFNEATVGYYKAVRKNNCKATHKENERLYLDGVKYPLEELYYELYSYFSKLDSDLLSNKRRCISSAYNDTRFCKDAPIKEYFYIRFKLDTVNKKNAPGFFFDASLTGYKYGLNIYNPDARGMDKIRDYILDNKNYAKEVIEKFNKAGLLEVQGEKYKRAYYPDENEVLQEWLERKRISFVHEDELSSVFYGRDMLNCILTAFDNVQDVYFVLKESLQATNV